jgi:Putative porin
MLNKTTVQLMALGLIGSMAATSFADDSALIDALVRKGVLKKGEAEQIRAQACKDCASDKLSGKVSLGESVSSLKLTGDLRVRYQYTAADPQSSALAATTNDNHETGFRLRLRINADYKVDENFFAGFGLRTGGEPANSAGGLNGQIGYQNRRSADTDLANSYHSNYSIGVSRAFIGWTPISGVTLIAGKQANPFYTTDMVWGSEVNPSGFTQQIDLSKVFGFSGVQLNLNSGQFVVQDNFEADSSHQSNRDAYIWQTQLVASAELASGVKLTVAPGFYSSNGAAVADPNGYDGSTFGTVNGTSIGNLQVLLLPGDVSTEFGGQKVKFQWDLAYNLDGQNRSFNNNIARSDASGTDNLAWLAGFQIGENNKKGDWSAVVNYRQVGLSAVDSAITDPDFGFGRTNVSGFKVGIAYNLGAATTIGASYYQVDNLRTGITQPGGNSSQIIQADVSVKF